MLAVGAQCACMQAPSHHVLCSLWQSSSCYGCGRDNSMSSMPPPSQCYTAPEDALAWQCTMAGRPPASTSSFAKECVSCVSAALVALCVHADFEKDAPHLLTAQHAQLAPTVITKYFTEWRICAVD